VEVVVTIEILDVMVDDEKEVPAGLRYEMEAHVDAGRLGYVVILDQVHP
jgi:hypothetical protein